MKSKIFIFALLFSFCLWLMFESFSYKDNIFYIADHIIYDFAVHIPLIRSFSQGDNFPPQYPLFPGEPIKYHFLFYFLVGMLEKTGLPIDWSLNIPAALGLFTLIVTLYLLTKKVFQRRLVAILTVVFLLFNGTLTFVKFLAEHPLSPTILLDLVNNKKFYSFGPYDGGEIGAFWNLTTFTNQRHFAWGMMIGLLFILTALNLLNRSSATKVGWAFIWGVIIGLLPFFHQSVLVIFFILIVLYFFLYPVLRPFLLVTAAISALLIVPQVSVFFQGNGNSIEWYPGFLIHDSLNPWHFLTYWFKNLGLHLFLIPAGLYLAPKKMRKSFLLPIFFIFLIPNLLRFSPEVATNHKFFNFAYALGSMFSAYTLVYLLDRGKRMWTVFILLLFFLTFSGVIDLFPLLNDRMHAYADAPKNEVVEWFLKNSEPDATVLNNSYIYHPASLAGRKIFLGWPMFADSVGYDIEQRFTDFKTLWESGDISFLCQQIKKQNISYVMYEKLGLIPGVIPKADIFDKYFPLLYENIKEGIKIYDAKRGCKDG